jgi:hypothetical protein
LSCFPSTKSLSSKRRILLNLVNFISERWSWNPVNHGSSSCP